MHKHEGPQIFVVLRKIWFKHMIKQNLSSPKSVYYPQTLKPGYGPDSAKIVSAIRIFCFEGRSASRCSVTSKTFLCESPLGVPVGIWGGGRVELLRHCAWVNIRQKHLFSFFI